MEYTKLIKFTYKNNNYQLLFDNKGKYFFLRINANGKYQYITFQEYVELAAIFTKRPSDVWNARGKVRIIPKIIIGATAITISLTTLTGCVGNILDSITGYNDYGYYQRYDDYDDDFGDSENQQSYDKEEIRNYLSYDDEQRNESLQLDTYYDGNIMDQISIYDMDYLNKVLPSQTVNEDMLKETVKNNSKIPESMKPVFYDYIHDICTKFDNIELRVFYENLKTLQVIECTDMQLLTKTMNPDSLACYNVMENSIYTLKGYNYVRGSNDYQILVHEISHALRMKWFKKDGKMIYIQPWGPNVNLPTITEALNSIFAVWTYNKEERDICYQVQSNYLLVLLDVLDNYRIEDYVQHSVSYLAQKMDEAHNDQNYALKILNLMSVQFDDYHSDSINVAPEEYYEIYDYLSDLYFKKYITPEMNYSQALEVCNKLIDIVTFDVPKEYYQHKSRFYYNLIKYCEQNNIKMAEEEQYSAFNNMINTYFSERITPDMSYDDALSIFNEYKYKITEGLTNTSNIDELFNNYCSSIGIKNNNR